MRILMIGSDECGGGIGSHVLCLAQCLRDIAEVLVCCNGIDSEFIRKCRDSGVNVIPLKAKNGHDLRVIPQIREIINVFAPDIVHLHGIALFIALYLKFFTMIPRICSLHTPSAKKVAWDRRILNWAVLPCYFLPVSGRTWERFRWNYPEARGEVFYNPIRFSECHKALHNKGASVQIVGMVGRFADQKDWKSFVTVCNIVHAKLGDKVRFLGVGVSEAEASLALGDGAKIVDWKGVQPNGREWIGRMDVFIMTSKHEEMPTTILEAFAMKTPIAGFIPTGGVEEIVEMCHDSGLWRNDRDCEGLANDVIRLLSDVDLREKCIASANKLVHERFDADKNCKGQLMDIYCRVAEEGAGK